MVYLFFIFTFLLLSIASAVHATEFLYDFTLDPESIEAKQQMENYCSLTDRPYVPPQDRFYYNNSTHFISSKSCTWEEIPKCSEGTGYRDGVCVVVPVERGILMHSILGPLLLVALVGILVSPVYAILKFKKPVNKTLFVVSISIASIIFSSVIYGEFLLVDDRTVAPSPNESFFFTLSILGSFFITISFVVLGVIYWRKNEHPNKMMLFTFFIIATIPIILLMTGVLPRGAEA